MRRAFVLGVIVTFGGLSMAAAAFQAPAASPSAAALAATKIEKVKDNLFVITGSNTTPRDAFSGGNTGVFITDRGVVVVDTKLANWGPTILERIKSVTNKPVVTVSTFFTPSSNFFNVSGHARPLPPLLRSMKGASFHGNMSPACIVRSAV